MDETTYSNPQALDIGEQFYSPNQIGFASYLGGPLAGCWLIATNSDCLKDYQTAKNFRFGGFVGLILLVTGLSHLPESFPMPKSLIPSIYTSIFYIYATKLFGEVFKAHKAGGGKVQNWLKVIGISLISLVGTIALFFAMGFLLLRG